MPFFQSGLQYSHLTESWPFITLVQPESFSYLYFHEDAIKFTTVTERRVEEAKTEHALLQVKGTWLKASNGQ